MAAVNKMVVVDPIAVEDQTAVCTKQQCEQKIDHQS
jgi:hypothetical protein